MEAAHGKSLHQWHRAKRASRLLTAVAKAQNVDTKAVARKICSKIASLASVVKVGIHIKQQ